MIAKPFSPGNAFPAEEVRARAAHVRQGDDRVVHQRRATTTCSRPRWCCTRRASRASRRSRATFAIFPGSGGVGRQIEKPDPRLDGESIAEVLPPSAARSASRGAVPASARARTRSRPGSARSRRSIGTGRTAWASAARATSPARRWSPPRRSPGTWRRRASSACAGIPSASGSDGLRTRRDNM